MESLDGIRAISILWVISCHVLSWWGPIFTSCNGGWFGPFLRLAQNGMYGVDFFFVLSGFLIGFILFKEIDRYGPSIDKFNFYRGRFLRLWPALLLWWIV